MLQCRVSQFDLLLAFEYSECASLSRPALMFRSSDKAFFYLHYIYLEDLCHTIFNLLLYDTLNLHEKLDLACINPHLWNRYDSENAVAEFVV